jgi:hypothetical protein
MGMGMHRIVEQMGKIELENWVKIDTLENGLLRHRIESVMDIHL